MSDSIEMGLEMAKESMDHAVEHLASELSKIRTGKASSSLLQDIRVEYYGAPTPLNQVANIKIEDGSIVNHSSQGKPLGYISDPSGIPCVAGRFVTNAPSFISQRIGLAGLGAAGSAYAEAQQQRQTSSLTGSTTSTVVGDINKLVAGEAVQSATDEVSRWLLARQKQSFDAVVVNPGVEVSVHLDRSLSLDKSSIARRLRYAKNDAHIDGDLD